MSDLRTKIAEALVTVTNRWIAPNFPADHKLREFAELDDREQRLNLDYADAALGVIGDDPAAGDPVEQCIAICLEEAKEWDSDGVQTLKNYAGHCANRIAAEVSRSAAMSEWQEIGTAPKDGTTILVWRPRESDDYPAHVGIDFWQQDAWWRSRRHQTPTHWMPLPTAPIARNDRGGDRDA